MTDKEKLQRKATEARKVLAQLEEIESAEALEKQKSKIGKCYKYYNSYDNDAKWWMYAKVTKANAFSLTADQFQKTSKTEFHFDLDQYMTESGWKEITAEEHNKQKSLFFVDLLNRAQANDGFKIAADWLEEHGFSEAADALRKAT